MPHIAVGWEQAWDAGNRNGIRQNENPFRDGDEVEITGTLDRDNDIRVTRDRDTGTGWWIPARFVIITPVVVSDTTSLARELMAKNYILMNAQYIEHMDGVYIADNEYVMTDKVMELTGWSH